MASGIMEVAALGRPFTLGMLYDARRDNLIPGKMWLNLQIAVSLDSKNMTYVFLHPSLYTCFHFQREIRAHFKTLLGVIDDRESFFNVNIDE